MSALETQPFWPDIVRLRDQLPLHDLATRFHTTPGAISAALERTGAHVEDEDAPEGDDLPPEPGDGALLPEVRRALEQLRDGSKDTLIAHHADLLGNVPDADVARAAGVSIRTIASFRARHAIPGYAGPRRKPERAGARRSRIDDVAHLIGTVPDEVIAEQAGVHVHAVRSYRARNETGQGATTPTQSGLHAWRVAWRSAGGRREGVLLAASLDEALQQLQQAALGDIVGIDLLGPVLGT